jgi:hypothetical protein
MFVPGCQYQAVKTCCATEVKLHTFLTSGLGGGKLITLGFAVISSDPTGFQNALNAESYTSYVYFLFALTTG